MTPQTEIEALQNAANVVGLKVYEKQTHDKRRTVKKFYLQNGCTTVSPVLDYEQLNYFIFGWIASTKNN